MCITIYEKKGQKQCVLYENDGFTLDQ